MIDVVKTVGRSIESQVETSPETARRILEAAYTWVDISGRIKQAPTYTAAADNFNGAIARTIVDALAHPENAVLVNIFLPCEILHAMGLTPMFPEVMSAYVACTCCSSCFCEISENHNIPESFCSYHKTMIGMAESGVLPAPAAIANTTLACDANQVSFRKLANLYHVPHYVVDTPHHCTEDAITYVENQLYELIAFLEESTHHTFNIDAFCEALACSQRTLTTLHEFRANRGAISLPTTTTGELLEMIATHLMLGTPEAEQFANKLLIASKHAPRKETVDKPRIFWVHTNPNWQMPLREILDGPHSSCELVGNDMTIDGSAGIDFSNPIRSLANRIVMNCFNGPGMRRIDNGIRQAKQAQADGVIVFCHWGCKQTLGISQLAKQKYEEAGFPTLVLDGDGCDPRNVADGQMITRINAFIEQLRGEGAE